MRGEADGRRPAILSRIVATLFLSLVAVALFLLGDLRVDKQIIAETVAGLLVLATAGIWVSYLAEEEARRTVLATAEGIRQATDLSRACAQIGLLHVFSSSDEEDYRHFLSDQLLRAHRKSDIRVVGVACRGFFHAQGGPHSLQIQALAERDVPMRIILAHPFFEPAITRGIREDKNRNRLPDCVKSILLMDVQLSCDGIIGLGRASIQARLCPIATGCRATFIGDLLIVEQLHSGAENQRASIDTPVLVFRKDAPYARQLAEHFEFLWQVSGPFPVTPGLVEALRQKDFHAEEQSVLVDYMKLCRPDLFAAGGPPAVSL